MDEQPPWVGSDPLGEALHALRMSGTFYCRSELTAPWGMTLPATPGCLWFHLATSGTCRVEVTGEPEPVWLRPGDLVLVPRGDEHVLRSAADVRAPDIRTIPHPMLDDRYGLLRIGEPPGDTTRMVCGAVRFEHPAAAGILDLMPRLLRIEPSALSGRLQDTLRLMAAEVEDQRPGGEAVITRLADVLVLQVIRTWLARAGDARAGETRVGWLGALSDPQIGPALAMVHRDPGRDWTLAAMAAVASMSRSSFAARFSDLVGEPPMGYVTRWRMQVALDDLAARDVTVAALAGRLGYRSEAAFSRAFTRVFGQSPSSVRVQARSERAAARALAAS